MRILLFFILLLICNTVEAQRLGFNDKLFFQLTKNQAVRYASNEVFQSNFREQNEMYDDIQIKSLQILSVHQYIYDKLRNVDTNIRQGKKLYYTIQYADDIVRNSRNLMRDAAQYPVVAATLTNYYTYIMQQALEIKQEVENVTLKESDHFIMDQYDREILLDKIYHRVKSINGTLQYISLLIDSRKNKPLIYHAPLIGEYVVMDHIIINSIMRRWRWITN